jgi:hypothetical protein
MSTAWLKASLALWRRRYDYRHKKQTAAIARRDSSVKSGTAKWGPLEGEAARRVHLREHQLAAKVPPPGKRKGARGLDWAWGNMSAGALLASGISFACRYLSHDPGKNLSRAEAVRLSKAGIDLVVVWETTADRARQGYSAGLTDAKAAWQQAKATGMPDRRPIYFAVDFDGAGPEVADYFRGAAAYLGVSRTGVYAGIRVVNYLFAHGLVAFAWQTYAWSGGQWNGRAQLRQVHNGVRVGGVDSDEDVSVADDFGQWRAQ